MSLDISDNTLFVYGLLAFFTLFSVWLFSEIIWVAFIGVSAAYILHPFNSYLKSKGLSSRVATILTSALSLLALIIIFVPFMVVLYRRRDILMEFLMDLPQVLEYEVLGNVYTVEVEFLISSAIEFLRDTAIGIASSFPTLILKLSLVVMIIYTLLRSPEKIQAFVNDTFGDKQKEILNRYHKRTMDALRGVYVIQFTSAILTFIVGLPVFYMLGYEPFIALSLVAAVLQLIPVAGPALLILGLAGVEAIAGNIVFAATVLISGLLIVAFTPDIVVRFTMADRTTSINPGLYFLGFVGGLLGLGAIGIIVGPLTVALMMETLDIFSDL